MAELVHRVVDVLAHLQMSFAAAGELVIERMRQFRELGLWCKMMSDTAHVLGRTVVEETAHPLARADPPQLLAQADVIQEVLLQLIPLWITIRAIHRPFRDSVRFR